MENNKIEGSVTEPSVPRVKNTDNFEVGIHEDNKTGWFHHHKYGDEFSGGLWFENNKLTDYDGVKLIGEIITISVNNVSYVRMVDSEGFASLKICLMSGEYIVTCNALNGLKSETILEVK